MNVARTGRRRSRENAIDGADRRLLGRRIEHVVLVRVRFPPAGRLPPIRPHQIAALDGDGLEDEAVAVVVQLRIERGAAVKAVERSRNLALERDERLDLTAARE